MGRLYTFHESVRGHLHVMNELPCEDSSSSYSAEDGKYHIAIVADGHGSKSCFRSGYGSKEAANVALECLRQFAEAMLASEEAEDRFYEDMFSDPRYRRTTIRRLTDTIIARWHDRVLDNYKNDPPSAEEMGESAVEYADGENLAHIYGTTLIAALQMPKCLVMLHQGDGRCDVFYTDGTVEQPIPWDSRCEGTAVTSLCDEDAADSFRSCVINLSEKPVMACFLGSDGVEDAYRDTYEGRGGTHVLMGGVHTFYKDLTCRLSKMGQAEFEDSLEAMLSDFSANGKFSRSGSGDDVSVAGIVDIDAIGQFVDKFEYDAKCYALEEDLFWKEDQLRGKSRKHGILRKRLDEAGSALAEAQKKQQLLETELQRLNEQKEECALETVRAKNDLEQYREESQLATEQFEGNFSLIATALQRFFEDIASGGSQREAAFREKSEKLSVYGAQIKRVEESIVSGADQIRELENKLDDAQAAFDEYDAKYQAIDSDRIRIKNEIAALQEGNP